MRAITLPLLLAAALVVAGCAKKFRTYDGPEVTRVVIYKGERRLELLHNDRVLKDYHIDLGFAPVGHKVAEGDGRTPEGDYIIDRRNPESAYYLSIGISYPNEEDIARAEELGVDPGGDIFIHGRKSMSRRDLADWTAGCISVTNREMEWIYAMVEDGTPITILP